MQKRNIVISYTRVSADIFHYGHLLLLKKVKAVSDYQICGLYSDKLCLHWNGSIIMNFDERIAILSELNCVSEIIEQKELEPIF